MAQIADNQLKEMIANIENPAVRAQYEAALTGATHVVKCLSKKCKGRVIGEKRTTGAWLDVSKDVDPKDRWGLRSTRQRLDGHTGFSCKCGNYSVTSKAEDGVITGSIPSKKELSAVYERQQKNKAKVKEHDDGSIEVDGFLIVPLKGGV